MEIYNSFLNNVDVYMLDWRNEYKVWDNKIKCFICQCNCCGFDPNEVIYKQLMGGWHRFTFLQWL